MQAKIRRRKTEAEGMSWRRVRFFLLTKGPLTAIIAVMVSGTVFGTKGCISYRSRKEAEDMRSQLLVSMTVVRSWFRRGVSDGMGCGGGSPNDYGAVVEYKGKRRLVKFRWCYKNNNIDRLRLTMVPGQDVKIFVRRDELSDGAWHADCDDVL